MVAGTNFLIRPKVRDVVGSDFVGTYLSHQRRTFPFPWTPRQLPGIRVWWSGADATINATPQFDWPNRVGGSFNYGQNTSANEPTLTTVNGQQVITFASTQFLVVDPNTYNYNGASTGPSHTIICVLTKSSVAQYAFSGNSGEGGPAIISHFNPGSGVKDFEYFYNSSERGTIAASTDTNLHIIALTRTDDVGNTLGYFDDPFTSVMSVAVNTGRDWTDKQIVRFGNYSGASLSYNGSMADFIHCNGILDPINMWRAFTYFKSLYAI